VGLLVPRSRGDVTQGRRPCKCAQALPAPSTCPKYCTLDTLRIASWDKDGTTCSKYLEDFSRHRKKKTRYLQLLKINNPKSRSELPTSPSARNGNNGLRIFYKPRKKLSDPRLKKSRGRSFNDGGLRLKLSVCCTNAYKTTKARVHVNHLATHGKVRPGKQYSTASITRDDCELAKQHQLLQQQILTTSQIAGSRIPGSAQACICIH
jgi:hypothetical protein